MHRICSHLMIIPLLAYFLVAVASCSLRRELQQEDFPSSNPSIAPTTSRSAFVVNNPSSNPTQLVIDNVIPTSRPSITIILQNPSTRPSSSPSIAVSPSVPSSHPSSKPIDVSNHLPTSIPSASSLFNQPTSNPTKVEVASVSITPTSAPSGFPTTSFPSKIPTSIPSSKPSTILPTSKPSTADPSSSPSLMPSSYPSIAPSSKPSSSPSSIPNAQPTNLPSISPTSYPTVRPSFMPTPNTALLGKKWWYLLKTDIALHSSTTLEKYTRVQMQAGVQEAVNFVLLDNLEDADSSKSYTVTQVYHPYEPTKPENRDGANTDDDYYSSGTEEKKKDDTETLSLVASKLSESNNSSERLLFYHVQTWCWTSTCAQSIRETWIDIHKNPLIAVEPLHEQGIRAIDYVNVLSVTTSISDVPPPVPPPLSPTRIVYIILGAILFCIITFIIIKSFTHAWENKSTIRRLCRTRWENIARPCHLFCYELHRSWRSGFSLTSVHDEDNFDRQQDFDQLSVHYDKHHINWQRHYLEDHDREESQRLRPSMRDESPAFSSEENSPNSVVASSANGEIAMIAMTSSQSSSAMNTRQASEGPAKNNESSISSERIESFSPLRQLQTSNVSPNAYL